MQPKVVTIQSSSDNDLWTHASSLESERAQADKIGELKFMKELFDNHLPVGKNREEIDKYFMDLEKVIYTEDFHKIKNDDFPEPDESECCRCREHDGSFPADHKCERREYKYFSADLLKQQASHDNRNGIDPIEHSNLCIGFSGYDDEHVEEIPDPADYCTPFRLGKVQTESEGSRYLSRLAEY
jgi:hypothetical protein